MFELTPIYVEPVALVTPKFSTVNDADGPVVVIPEIPMPVPPAGVTLVITRLELSRTSVPFILADVTVLA